MRRTVVRMLLVLSAIFLIFGTATFLIAKDHFLRPGPLQTSMTIIIERGGGVGKIAAYLKDAGVIENAVLFRLGVRYEGLASKLKAGEYVFPAHASMRSVAAIIASGKTVKRRLTIAEGLLAVQIKKIVLAVPGLTGEVPESYWQDGTLLPETYFYSYGDSRLSVIKRMQEQLKKVLSRTWAQRSTSVQLKSPEEALILASIIEKETGKASERAHISGVFHNRLRRRMPLQSDPTVVYGVTNGKRVLNRPLTKADLRTPSPYNTYLNNGLPPAPIANAGLAAIRAAVMPITTTDLYFVADGKGGHAFARTHREHNRNVAKWRKIQRKVRDRK
ncbi:MAG: aminodeoxychorismate lyase [Rhodospirillaceae bacterium]|nr:aminodeoxychorismate lyase [Rhodospirillaceae bacterium]